MNLEYFKPVSGLNWYVVEYLSLNNTPTVIYEVERNVRNNINKDFQQIKDILHNIIDNLIYRTFNLREDNNHICLYDKKGLWEYKVIKTSNNGLHNY